MKLKAEVEAEALTQADSPEGIRAFRELWALAFDERRKQKEIEAEELRQALDALATENEKLDAHLTAANSRMAEVEKQRDGLVAELAKANDQVTAARAAGEQHSTKLAEALERTTKLQEAHAKELADLRLQLATTERQAHSLELKLARAEAKLEK